jgi:polyphosphate kinase
VLTGSADLMPRNLDSRVELVTPIEDEGLRAELLGVLERCLADNANAWELGADGIWARRVAPPGERRSVQEELCERHLARGTEQLAAAAG